jgi:molecular chaperone HtpG
MQSPMTDSQTAAPETHHFQAEVSRLLDIVAHSLYSDRRIFLRELISNAADACDRLRYEGQSRPELLAGDPELRITIAIDKPNRVLTIADNGIGMSHDDLVENLGTIARSGTAKFMQTLSGDAKKDVSLIGQFGVGFYSAYMVADRVNVVSRKAGEDSAWQWSSDGRGAYTVTPAERAGRGTSVMLHMREDAGEFLEPLRLRAIVAQYSDHIALPIVLKGEKDETINRASALWTRAKGEVTADQHKEFYAHVAHTGDEPWLTLHWRAEGKIEYSSLLYIPSSRPFDLFEPERRHGVRLYVRRVFITDKCEDLVPRYLRFLRGVVDSEDLPLNISREMLQHNPVLSLIRTGVTNRVLADLEKKAKESAEDYAKFWENFGAVLKEGLYEDRERRDALLALARFRTTTQDGLSSLADIVARMKPGQEAIFYIAGDESKALATSPQLEGFRKRGVEVLLFTDPVDEFWVNAVGAFQGKPFKSVTRGAADLSKIAGDDKKEETPKPETPSGDVGALVALFRLALQDDVKDVRVSERLTDSPVCLVADENDLDMHLERILRQHKQLDQSAKRILEINADHALIRALAGELPKNPGSERMKDIAHLLLDQARILNGETVADAALFARRLSDILVRAAGG